MQKNKKQFGVWMDTQHATIVGRENVDEGPFVVIDHINNPGFTRDSDENGMHNKEIGLTQKFFKEIAHKMQNVDEIHLTGTGKIQEEFIHFLADTPQYKNAHSSESTSKKMSDDQLIAFITKHFNS
jgi:stalled ribosome rescue protein Dom34